MNNDGELAIDISESDEMEELLQKEIDNQVRDILFHMYFGKHIIVQTFKLGSYPILIYGIFLGGEL